MTAFQKTVKYIAIGLACLLAFGIISGIASGVLFFLGGGNVSDSMQTREITKQEQITSLDIELSAAELTVTTGEAFAIESNLKKLTVMTRGNSLIIKEKSNYFFGVSLKKTPKVNLVLPAILFEKAELETGAGKVEIESITAKNLSLEFGAGEVTVDYLEAQNGAEIEGGAGKFTLNNGILHNADIEIGVGESNITAKLTGRNTIDCGVGATALTLLGVNGEYKVKTETGIGATYIEGEKAANNTTYGNGENAVTVKGGIGEVNIRFKETE